MIRNDKLFASYVIRSDLPLSRGVYMIDIGPIRVSLDEARRDAILTNPPGTPEDPSETPSTPVLPEEIAELGMNRSASAGRQDSVCGYCAVAECVLENRTAYVGVCVFCDLVLVSGPCRGAKASAESDAFQMVSEVLSNGITFAAEHHELPPSNPAEDIFLPQDIPEARTDDGLVTATEDEEMAEDDETNVPVTPTAPLENTEESSSTTSSWASNDIPETVKLLG